MSEHLELDVNTLAVVVLSNSFRLNKQNFELREAGVSFPPSRPFNQEKLSLIVERGQRNHFASLISSGQKLIKSVKFS